MRLDTTVRVKVIEVLHVPILLGIERELYSVARAVCVVLSSRHSFVCVGPTSRNSAPAFRAQTVFS